MILTENLELNITDDNNFYVSRTLMSKIQTKLDNRNGVTHEERELYDMVKQRRKICELENIHYWILPDPSTSLDANCHWCELSLAEYSQRERTHNN